MMNTPKTDSQIFADGTAAAHPDSREELQHRQEQFMLLANHELRTPATVIALSLELLARHPQDLSPKQRKMIDNARQAAARLRELLNDFQGILSPQREILRRQPLDLAALLQQLGKEFSQPLRARGISLRIIPSPSEQSPSGQAPSEQAPPGQSPPEKPFRVVGSRAALQKAFDHLLRNAVKFTADGGEITVALRRKGSRVLVFLEDNGIGLPRHMLETIFDPFFQLQDVQRHHSSRFGYLGGGAGLGLSYCRRIVNAHGGRIWAESDGEGLGSRFCVALPAEQQMRPADATSPIRRPRLSHENGLRENAVGPALHLQQTIRGIQ